MLLHSLNALQTNNPRVHCITNYVTANDCANALLAVGASPIMADAPAEVGEITAQCQGLLLNLGTPKATTLPAMQTAGQCANRLGHSVVLDPVGVGASAYRAQLAQDLLSQVGCTVIRGNFAEIGTLAGGLCAHTGVDTSTTAHTIADALTLAHQVTARTGAVVVVSGAVDVLTDGKQCAVVRGGSPLLARMTGAGCILSALIAAFVASGQDPFADTLTALCAMSVCAEQAQAQAQGSASFRMHLLDALYNLTPTTLSEGATYEILT